MGVSTNSIFHFTSSKTALKSILKDGGFKLTFCLEKFHLDKGLLEAEIPMVSFCDIPLAKVVQHLKSYGKYGIALSKSWATKMGLNPVIYMNKNSTCASMIEPLIIETFNNDEYGDIGVRFSMSELKDGNVEVKGVYKGDRKKKIDSLIGQLSFMKNHHGELYRNGKLKNSEYKFYDEREWRYVPMYEDFEKHRLSYEPFLSKEEYTEWRSRTKKKEFFPKMLLPFSSKDIEYIIVKDEQEVSTTIRQIEKYNTIYSSADEFRLLISKIYPANKIIEDI